MRNRFSKIKAVFNFGLERCDEKDKAELRRVLDLCMILKWPEEVSDPAPIAPADFEKLLAVAKTREKAILLLGMNACMHSGETAVLKADIDLDERTLSIRRSKTSRPRVAWLWQRTVDAIRAYLKRQPLSPIQNKKERCNTKQR